MRIKRLTQILSLVVFALSLIHTFNSYAQDDLLEQVATTCWRGLAFSEELRTSLITKYGEEKTKKAELFIDLRLQILKSKGVSFPNSIEGTFRSVRKISAPLVPNTFSKITENPYEQPSSYWKITPQASNADIIDQSPYELFEFKKNAKKSILFFGVEHLSRWSSDLNSSPSAEKQSKINTHIELIENELNQTIKTYNPEIIVLEGMRTRGGLLSCDISPRIFYSHDELAEAALLALQQKQIYLGGEPNEDELAWMFEHRALGKIMDQYPFNKEDFFRLRDLYLELDKQGNKIPKETLHQYESLLKKYTHFDFTKDSIDQLISAFNVPLEISAYPVLAQVHDLNLLLRDAYLREVTRELEKRYHRVMIVYGRYHLHSNFDYFKSRAIGGKYTYFDFQQNKRIEDPSLLTLKHLE